MAVLPKRVACCGLTIHPTKTVRVSFRKPVSQAEANTGHGTFALLGFTHDWTTSRRGYGVIKRRTASTRLRRTRRALWPWCRDQRHPPLQAQYRPVYPKRRGHYQYDGIRGHDPSLERLYEYAGHAWRYWLSRRRRRSAIPWATCDQRRMR